ncbi:hypothetical protein D4R71_03950 [bacterium]|nr:MAG: hypothetical protein D4R71_03950 [bacterium]
MDIRKLKKIILYVSVIALFFIIMSVIFSFHAIYTGVKNICVSAKEEFGQNCVQSLMMYIQSGNHSEKDKTHAVWALGQLADKNTLPFLENLQKEYTCENEQGKSKICYEIYKAIKWCTHGNATSWMYKNREKW